MRLERGRAAGALLLAGVTIATCVYPTEHDAAVHVSLTPVHILFSGHDTVAAARAWQVRGPGDSVVIPNVAFTRSTSDAAVATVSSDGRIVGIKSGSAIITAAATNFDAGQRAAADTVRVSAPIEVDSIRPKTVRYGEFLTVYGIGVDSIFVASLDSASLIPNPVEDTTYAQGTQRRRYWVPFPARTDSLLIIGIYNGNGVFGFVHGDTTKVVERDIYEPDDTIPHHIDLDAAPPFAALPTLLFFNPALAFERLKRSEKAGVDWYHFTQAQPRDLTIVLTAPQIAGTVSTFLTDRRRPARHRARPVPRHADHRKPARRRLDQVPLHQRRTRHHGAVPHARVPRHAPRFPQGPRSLRRRSAAAIRHRAPGAAGRHDRGVGCESHGQPRHRRLLPGDRGLRGRSHHVRGVRRDRSRAGLSSVQQRA